MRNKKARKNEQLFICFVVFLHSINKNQVAFISALEEPRIPARFPKAVITFFILKPPFSIREPSETTDP